MPSCKLVEVLLERMLFLLDGRRQACRRCKTVAGHIAKVRHNGTIRSNNDNGDWIVTVTDIDESHTRPGVVDGEASLVENGAILADVDEENERLFVGVLVSRQRERMVPSWERSDDAS